jgi:hypothetical protein
MRHKDSKPIARPARFAQSALLGLIYITRPSIKVFAQMEKDLKKTELMNENSVNTLIYLKKLMYETIKVSMTASVILFEWRVINPQPIFLGWVDLHMILIDLIIIYSSVLCATRCIIELSIDMHIDYLGFLSFLKGGGAV